MKVEFRLVAHTQGGHMIELWEGAEFIAGVYPGDRSVKVVSKHPMSTVVDESERPAAVVVEIGRLQ